MGALSALEAALVAALGVAWLVLAAQLVLLVPMSLAYGLWKSRALRRLETCPFRGRVTVLVPAYDEERTLRACVESILASDYPDLEVIVIDDGSTDATARTVEDLADGGRIQLIRRPNGGKARALNTGIAAASGDVVIFTDADSVFLPGTVRQMARWFADPGIQAVCGNDRPLRERAPLQKALAVTTHIGTGFVRRALSVLGVLPIITGNLGAVRTATLRELGGFRPVWGEDLELTFRLQRARHRIVFDPDPVVLADCPAGLAALWRQRIRWVRSYIKVVGMHPALLWPATAPPFSAFLPVNAFAQVVVPLLQLAALPLLLQAASSGSGALEHVAAVLAYAGLLTFIAISVFSISLDRFWPTLRHVPIATVLILPLSYFYNCVVVASVWKELRGEAEHWGKIERVPALGRWGGLSLILIAALMAGWMLLMLAGCASQYADGGEGPGEAGSIAVGTHFDAWSDWTRALSSIVDRRGGDRVNVVGIGAGRAEWTHFRWAGHEDRWSALQRSEDVDLLARSVETLRGRGLRVVAIVDVLAPEMIETGRARPAVRFDGGREQHHVEFMELVEGGYGGELIEMAHDIARAYDVEAVAFTEIGYRFFCYCDRCLASYRSATGRGDWPRRSPGVADVDDPSVWEWRSARVADFLGRAASAVRAGGKRLYVDVPASWDDLSRQGRDSGLDYARVLDRVDRIVVWNYFALEGRPPEISRDVAQLLRRSLPANRVFVSIGLWAERGRVLSPGDLERAMRFTREGGITNLWITPVHMMTQAHWDAIAAVAARPDVENTGLAGTN